MQELRSWIEKSFGKVPNRELGVQDFAKKCSTGMDGAESIGTMPYAGKENEILVMNSYTDLNKLFMCFSFKNDFERFSKKSLDFINGLLGHQGAGSLFDCLK